MKESKLDDDDAHTPMHPMVCHSLMHPIPPPNAPSDTTPKYTPCEWVVWCMYGYRSYAPV